MISHLQPASRAQFVSFGNVATQDVIRACTLGFEARGVPLPTGASKGSGVPFARVGCFRSPTCKSFEFIHKPVLHK